MWERIKKNIDIFASLATVTGAIIAVVLWSHNGLSNQIDEIRTDTKLAHARIDSHIVSSNQRIDATNQRIDHTYDLILEILRENKKEDKK